MKTKSLLFSLALAVGLSGCNLGNEAHQKSGDENTVNFSHNLTATHSRALDFDNAPFDIPGTPASLMGTAAGPFDLSGVNMLHFSVQITDSTMTTYESTVTLDNTTGAVPAATTLAEVAASFAASLPANIAITQPPLNLSAIGDFSNGSTITLIPITQTGITLATLGFSENNRANTGIADSSTADYLFSGTMFATSDTTGETKSANWSIYLEQDGFQVVSNSNMSLVADDYTFTLDVVKDNLHYIGTTQATVHEGDNSLSMLISPVINYISSTSSVVDHSLISTLTRYDIYYLNAQPSYDLGISINSETEQLISIADTHDTATFFLDLTSGPQQISLNLYDGINLIGSSLPEQENQDVVAGRSITMDIAPILGIAEFSLSETGGSAQISINIPPQVSDEVGGSANLAATLSIQGGTNNIAAAPFTITDATADILLTSLHYGDAMLTINYLEIDSGDVIATCEADIMIHQDPTFQCDLNVRQPALLEGELLSYLGLNVSDSNGEPISGATITNTNNELVGVTGTHAFGTPGYVNLTLTTGSHNFTISSSDGLLTNFITVNVTHLEVINQSVFLH